MTQRVILFVFAGRKGNMQLQVPMVQRILAEHPGAEYHVWNLTKTTTDDAYVRAVHGERVIVHNELHGQGGPTAFRAVYRHYGEPEYEGCLFVKLDDDIVFVQTARFGAFLAVVDAYRDRVVSANVVNNGACCPLEPALWAGFESLDVPLLEIHKQNGYAEIAHRYFFDYHAPLLRQPVELVPTEDWLSINMIGYDWRMAREFADRLGTVPHPALIAGRKFPAPWGLMDEGCVNLFPRMIVRGFVACHLTFGPQHCTGEQCVRWRRQYAEIGRRYLEANAFRLGFRRPDRWGAVLPGLSAVSHAQEPMMLMQMGWGATGEIPGEENDPCVGRFIA